MIAEVLDCVSFKEKSECLLETDPYHPHIIIYGVILGISSLGIINNLVCFYIFSSCQSMKNSFFKYMNMYSVNSLLVNLNDFIVILWFFFKNQKLVVIDGMDWFSKVDYPFIAYYTYFYIIVWSVVYTCGSLLDIQILYTRIQLFYINLNFLRKTPVYRIGLIILLASVIINLPVNIQRTTIEVTYNYSLAVSSGNVTQTFVTYGSNRHQHSFFIMLTYCCLFIRDVLALIFEASMNTILMVSLNRYTERRIRLLSMAKMAKIQTMAQKNSQITSENPTSSNKSTNAIKKSVIIKSTNQIVTYKKSDKNNIIITIIVCILSMCSHLFTFVCLYMLIYSNTETFILFSILSGFFNGFKHAVNFFIFLALNKKFRSEYVRIFCDNKD